jgi:hypothetical protein
MRGDLRIVGGSLDMLNKINERMNLLFGTNINKLYGPKNKNYKFIEWAGMKDIENIYIMVFIWILSFFSKEKNVYLMMLLKSSKIKKNIEKNKHGIKLHWR